MYNINQGMTILDISQRGIQILKNIIKSDLTEKVIKIFALNFQLRFFSVSSRCHKNLKFVG